jgi:transcriptional regulator with XRE-family HTH domain
LTPSPATRDKGKSRVSEAEREGNDNRAAVQEEGMSKPTDLKRQRLVAKLRAAGKSYQAIGDRLGVSPQRVHQILQRNGSPRTVPIPCRKCKTVIANMRMNTNNNGPVYCMACLPHTATIGQRLKARRLASGLTLNALSRQTLISSERIGNYEQGVRQPTWQSLAKLIRVLGVAWLDVRRGKDNAAR